MRVTTCGECVAARVTVPGGVNRQGRGTVVCHARKKSGRVVVIGWMHVSVSSVMEGMDVRRLWWS